MPTYALSERLNQKVDVIAIGTSTGGPEALVSVLSGLPAHIPPIVVVQHMPKVFVPAFAHHLNSHTVLNVQLAQHQTALKSGHVYIAPGDQHLEISPTSTGQLLAILNECEPVNRHRPSADVLFDSVAAGVGARSVGILLTGMGKDGAQGLLRMRQTGAMTLAQDEASAVVYGMPREAARLGAACHVMALTEIAPYLVHYLMS